MKEENGGERGVQPLNMVDKSTMLWLLEAYAEKMKSLISSVTS